MTIENYQHYLKRFLKFTGNINPGAINLDLVRNYRIELNRFKDPQNQPLQKSTQNYHVIALRAFLKYLAKRDVDTLSAEKVELAKVEDRSLTFLETDELEKLLAQPDINTLAGLRDRAILETLFSTGMRISELVSLKIEQISLKRNEFTVHGKGGKNRLVFLSDRAKDFLERYFGQRHDESPYAFIAHHSKEPAKKSPTEPKSPDQKEEPTQYKPITPRSVQRILVKYSHSAGLSKKITPHSLRHTFATDLLAGGADLRAVQSLLGHKNITTTQIYTHITDQHLRDVHQAFHGRKARQEELEKEKDK